jgi:hypothetical protein
MLLSNLCLSICVDSSFNSSMSILIVSVGDDDYANIEHVGGGGGGTIILIPPDLLPGFSGG